MMSVVLVLGLAAVSQGELFYQSDFTGADLASAGLETSAGAAGGYWTLDDPNNWVDGVGSGNARASLFTTESWQSDDGFTLHLTFHLSAALTRHSFGIVDADWTIPAAQDWLNESPADAYGIGFSTAGSGPSDYLGFNNDAGTVTVLSTAQGDVSYGALQTMSISVTSNSWSYSLNGQTATTGTWATPFDTSRNYRFVSYGHRVYNARYTNIKIRDTSTGYQSNFDTATDLASAGLAKSAGAAGGSWTLNTTADRLDGVGGGNARSSVYTTDSWQNDEGFALNVTFWGSSALVRHSFGIADAAWAISAQGDWLGQGLSAAYGIGFTTAGNLSGAMGGDGLAFNDGTGSGGDYGGSSGLSTAQGDKTSAAKETMTLRVTPDSWSYSLNGAEATTGLFSTPFDTSRHYRFIAYAQSCNRANFSNITLAPFYPEGTVLIVR